MNQRDQDTLLSGLGTLTRGNVIPGAEADSYLQEWRRLWPGQCLAVARPGSTEEAADIVRFCQEHALPVVPQGGNTGLVGGQSPQDERSVVISLERMKRIGPVNAHAATLYTQAGATLSEVQEAAREAGMLFPVSMASEGSAQVGGAISTNAGGISVLAYGTMRERVLGLEVVLPDGRIWNGQRALRKDNTGYDLKQIFMGAEGTLGLITGAVLRLAPAPKDRVTLWLAVETAEDAVSLFHRLSGACGPALTSFELISAAALDLAFRHNSALRAPVGARTEYHVLAEISIFETISAEDLAMAALGPALENGTVADAALATSGGQRSAMWALREALPEAQAAPRAQIKHDATLPVAAIPEFLLRAGQAVETCMPGIRPVPFGHLGDGNLHYNLLAPEGMDPEAFAPHTSRISQAVYDIVQTMDGSISAEHGIGRLKRELLAMTKSDVELSLMRTLKHSLDPKGIMNPGILFDPKSMDRFETGVNTAGR